MDVSGEFQKMIILYLVCNSMYLFPNQVTWQSRGD